MTRGKSSMKKVAEMNALKSIVMHANKRYNNILYTYNTNCQYFAFWRKISQIVTKMDF